MEKEKTILKNLEKKVFLEDKKFLNPHNKSMDYLKILKENLETAFIASEIFKNPYLDILEKN